MRESSGVGTEADIGSGCLHQFFSLLIFFYFGFTGIGGCNITESDFWVWSDRCPSCRTGKGILLTTLRTWTGITIPRLRTTITPCTTTPSSADRACGGSSITVHRTGSKEAIPEVAGHLVHPGGAAGASSSPLFSSAWGRLGRSSASQSTFQTKAQR